MSRNEKIDIRKSDTYIHAQLSKVRKPIRGYPVKGVWIVYCIDYANDMRLAYLALQMVSVLL